MIPNRQYFRRFAASPSRRKHRDDPHRLSLQPPPSRPARRAFPYVARIASAGGAVRARRCLCFIFELLRAKRERFASPTFYRRGGRSGYNPPRFSDFTNREDHPASSAIAACVCRFGSGWRRQRNVQPQQFCAWRAPGPHRKFASAGQAASHLARAGNQRQTSQGAGPAAAQRPARNRLQRRPAFRCDSGKQACGTNRDSLARPAAPQQRRRSSGPDSTVPRARLQHSLRFSAAPRRNALDALARGFAGSLAAGCALDRSRPLGKSGGRAGNHPAARRLQFHAAGRNLR